MHWFLAAKEKAILVSNQYSLQLRLICSQLQFHSERIPFEKMLHAIITEATTGINNSMEEEKYQHTQREQSQVLLEFLKEHATVPSPAIKQCPFLSIQKAPPIG